MRQRHVLVNVKRLHPLAGQRYLLEALGEVVRTHPDTRLVICGTGPLLDELKGVARANGVRAHVTFAGLVDNQTIAQIRRGRRRVRAALAARGMPDRRTRGAGQRHAGRARPTTPAAWSWARSSATTSPSCPARIRWRWPAPSSPCSIRERRVRESTRRILEQEFRPPAVDAPVQRDLPDRDRRRCRRACGVIRRVLLLGLLGAVTGIASVAVAYLNDPVLRVDIGPGLAAVARGFYPPERAGDLVFAWTSSRADLSLRGFDRTSAWTCTLRFRGARAAARQQPLVQIAADGVVVARQAGTNEYQDLAVTIPTRAKSGLLLTIATAPTFVPGPEDSRELGVQVQSLTCQPNDRFVRAPRALVTAGGLSAAVFGAAFGALGLAAVACRRRHDSRRRPSGDTALEWPCCRTPLT